MKRIKPIFWPLIDDCPLGRLGETKDVAPVVGVLATDDSEWINGQAKANQEACRYEN